MTTARSLSALLAGTAPLTWVTAGDSITHGLRHTRGARSYPEHLHELIRGDLGRRTDTIINTAISGHKVTDILDDFPHRVSRWSPDVVTIMIGTNDCAIIDGLERVEPGQFAEGLTDLILRVQSLGAVPVLQTPPPIDPGGAPNRARLPEFVDAVRFVATDTGAILVDHHAHWLELGGNSLPWPLLDDPFHPGALGHKALALKLASVFGLPHELSTLNYLRGALRARGLESQPKG